MPETVPLNSPPSSLSPVSSTSIYSAVLNLSATSSSVPAVSTLRLFNPSTPHTPHPPASSSYEPPASSTSCRLTLVISNLICPKSCVSPYMPALRPAHSWRLPHDVFACSPAALVTNLARARRSVSPMPTGHTHRRLSSATSRYAISARYAAQGGEDLSIQSSNLAATTLSSSDAHPKQRSQFLSSIASAPSTPAAPESFHMTHVTSSSAKLRGTVSGTSPYSSKAAQAGFSMRDTHMSRCFFQRTSATGRPVFVHW